MYQYERNQRGKTEIHQLQRHALCNNIMILGQTLEANKIEGLE